MFYTIELLRCMQAIHECGVAHGNLKPENILLRNDANEDEEWSRTWSPEGSGGWHKRGVAICDWSQAVEVSSGKPFVQCQWGQTGMTVSVLEVGCEK